MYLLKALDPFRAPHLLWDALNSNPSHLSQRLVAVKSQNYVNHMAGTVTSVVPLQLFLSLRLSSKMERKGKSNWICCWKMIKWHKTHPSSHTFPLRQFTRLIHTQRNSPSHLSPFSSFCFYNLETLQAPESFFSPPLMWQEHLAVPGRQKRRWNEGIEQILG